MFDKYYRLICFVVNICPELLRDLFSKFAKSDGSTYTTLPTYLSTKKSDIQKMIVKRKIREDQVDLLYPGHGKTTNVSDWDLSLLVTLILGLFKAKMSLLDIYYINEIREVRNQLQHVPDTAQLSNDGFDTYFKRLEIATTSLAKQEFATEYQASLKTKLLNTKINHLPDLGDCLRLWYEEIIKQMNYKMENMTNKMNEMENTLNAIHTDTKSTNSLLQSVTIQEPGNSENKRKILRVPDKVLSHIQARFERSSNALQDSFSDSKEIVDIQKKLKEKHYVVIAGTYNSQCYEIALAAVKGMSYNHKRCVELHKPSDWCLIGTEDVDLVICRDPFGSTSYDESRASSMAENFDSMLQTTKGDGDETIHIIMITDFTVLCEVKQKHNHAILKDVLNVFGPATEEHPTDLTIESGGQVSCFSGTHNLPDMTEYFLKQYKVSSELVHKDVLQTARETFKKKKSVVIAGPDRCGKTSLAVALASSYKPSECLRLTRPSDVKKIDFSRECLIIIDEFAGKYRYDENVVYKWYEMFDLLETVLSNGKINIVITCEKSKLNRCCATIKAHPLLEHRVDLSKNCIVLKRKIKAETHEKPKLLEIESLESSLRNPFPKMIRVWSVDDVQTYNIKAQGDKKSCYIKGACTLPTGEILIADWANRSIKKLNDKYRLISMCHLSNHPNDVCYIGCNIAVIALREDQLNFVDVMAEMKVTKKVKTDHCCKALAYHHGQLFVIDQKSIYVYNTFGQKQRVLFTDSSGIPDFRHIAVNDDGSKIYVTSPSKGLITVNRSGKMPYTFTDSKHQSVSGVCVDGKGHVLTCEQPINAEGEKRRGKISYQSGAAIRGHTCFFDRRNLIFVTAGKSLDISVYKLKYTFKVNEAIFGFV